MSIQPEAIRIFGGLGAVLVLATIVGALLPRNPAVQNANARIRAWWVMIAISGAVLAAGPIAITALFLNIAAICAYEFLKPRRRPWDIAMACLIAGGILSVPALLWLGGPKNQLLVVFLVLIVQASDVLQYLWGKLAGRHQLAPTISPGKTVEGLIGGIASATALGAALYWLTPFPPLTAAALTLAATCAGVLGGLILSAMKRERGIKDWGSWIAGHGGLLDRMDSIWLSAPIFYVICRARIL